MLCAPTCRLRVESWAAATGADVRALLHREYTRWSVDLGWDLSRDWAAVEPARRSGLLPGWLTRDGAGVVTGWAFAADHDHARLLGALVADDAESARALLDVVRASAGERRVGGFLRPGGAGGTSAAFAGAGFVTQTYEYLAAPIAPASHGSADDGPAGCWDDADADAVAALFAEAYRADTSLRPFAPQGTVDQWRDYVDALTRRPGCGVFSPQCSVVLRDQGRVVGAALVTSVGPTTAHLAQLAIAPSRRGHGLGAELIGLVGRRAWRALRASRVSLLVSSTNRPARRLYDRLGFRAEGTFLALAVHQHRAVDGRREGATVR